MLARFLRCFHNPATLCISVKFYYSCQEKMFFKLNELILENSCLNYDFYHLIALTLIKKLGPCSASPLTKSLFTWTVFPDKTIFFSHNNQSEQYFDLFFSPAEQALGSIGSKFLKVTLLKIIFPFCLFEDSKDNLSWPPRCFLILLEVFLLLSSTTFILYCFIQCPNLHLHL